MEDLQPKVQCDNCSISFENIDVLARQKMSHLVSVTPGMSDGLLEEAESEDLAEVQQNDRSNDLANRTKLDNNREDSEWQVSPNQTLKTAKSIQPIGSV